MTMLEEMFYQGICLQNKRPSNMDSVVMCRRKRQEDSVALFAVCDGVGSSKCGGEVAAFFASRLEDWFFSQEDFRFALSSLGKELFQLNQETLQWLQGQSGSSTLSLLLATPKKNFFAHVGDSRIYQKEEQQWDLITFDHCTDQGELFDYLGKKKDLAIDLWEEPQTGGEFLLCTDGFYHLQDWDQLAKTLKNCSPDKIRPCLKKLSQFVIAKGEQDNCSAIYCNLTPQK